MLLEVRVVLLVRLALVAGAGTRLLLSSTWAVSDTEYTLNTP